MPFTVAAVNEDRDRVIFQDELHLHFNVFSHYAEAGFHSVPRFSFIYIQTKGINVQKDLKKNNLQHAVLQFSNQEALKDVFSIQIQAS